MLTYDEGLFIGYRRFDRDGRQPLFPFGHGTGYTTWSFESITVPEGVTGAPACGRSRCGIPARGAAGRSSSSTRPARIRRSSAR